MSNRSQTGVGITDRSIASLSGSSQLLMGQNSQRGALLIQNTGNANLGFAIASTTEPSQDGTITNGVVTAAIGSAGTYTLLPAGSYEPDGGFIPTGAIYVIGTASQSVAAFESN